jgi:hypothetical protein
MGTNISVFGTLSAPQNRTFLSPYRNQNRQVSSADFVEGISCNRESDPLQKQESHIENFESRTHLTH